MKYLLLALGILLPGICLGSLEIKEIGFGGTDEWVYIQNTGRTGSILIEGLKTGEIEVELTSSDDFIIGDNEENVSGHQGVYYGGQGLSLVDSKAIEIKVYASGSLLDEVYFSEDLVIETKKEGNKIVRDTEKIIGSEMGESSLQEDNAEGGVEESLEAGGLTFYRIKPHDGDNEKEYIELQVNQSFEGSIEIVGLGQSGGSKIIDINVGTGDIVRISDEEKDDNDEEYIYISSISLTDSGEELQIVGQSGQVIDKAVYNSSPKGSLLEFLTTQGSFRLFGVKEGDTGKFPVSYLPRHGCSIIIQNKKPLYAGDSINFILGNKGKELRNGSATYHCEREGVEHSESTKCNPGGFVINDPGIHIVRVRIFHENEICETAMSINLPEEKREEEQRMKNEENQGERDKEINRDKEEFGITYTGSSYKFSERSLVNTGVIMIEGILPNPEGSDGVNEGLVLKNISTSSFDTSGLIVQSDNRKYEIQSRTVSQGEEILLNGEYGFFNREACVQLVDEEGTLYDSICYPEAGNGVWYGRQKLELELELESSYMVELVCVEEAEPVIHESAVTDRAFVTSPLEVKIKPNNYSGEIYSGAILGTEEVPEVIHQPGVLKIISVLPNPEGSDGGKESIVIEIIESTNEAKDLVDRDRLVVNSGKRSKVLEGGVKHSNTEFIRTGDLGLYNSPHCIQLESDTGTIYDEFCYPKADTGSWYSHSLPVEIINSEDRLSSLSLDITDEEICVEVLDSDIICKANPKISTEKKLLKEKSKREKDQEEFEKKLESLKDDLNNEKDTNNLHEEFIYSSMNTLNQDRYTVSETSGLLDQYNNRKQQKSGNPTQGSLLTGFDQVEQFSISNHYYPIDSQEIGESIETGVASISSQWNTLLNNLKVN